MGLAYGYQLFAKTPATQPEIFVDGWPMSSIAPWSELHTKTRLTGDWEITWTVLRPPNKQVLRHPAFFYGAAVEVRYGPVVAAVGSLTEPNWESGEMVALGAPREAEGALSLTAGGTMTTKPNTAVDQAIARGALNWVRIDDFGSTAIGQADGAGDLNTVAKLLDARAEDADNASGWRVDRHRGLRIVSNDETATPSWFITPGAGELGASDDERVDRVYVRFADSGAGGALDTASYPATTPLGGIERGADITGRGSITAAKAGKIAQGLWRKMQGRSGFTNGFTVDRTQVTSRGGIAAGLWLIAAGQVARQLGAPDPRGLSHHVDFVIGDTDLDWTANEIQINPDGMAARTWEAVLEADGRGYVAL